ALTFAELGGLYNASGAQYQILRDSYGPLPAFLFVFCNATAIQAGVIGIIAMICALNIGAAVNDVPLSNSATLALALALIVGLAGANILGVRWGAQIQNPTVYGKIITLAAVTIMAMLAKHPYPIFEDAAPPAGGHHLTPLQGVLAALVPALFSYGGWQ